VDSFLVFWQVVNIALLIGWIVLGIVALLQLRRRQLPPMIQLIWVALILLVPFFGALAFLIVRPGRQV
jgi:type III secretory pathway component EscS